MYHNFANIPGCLAVKWFVHFNIDFTMYINYSERTAIFL